MNEKQAEAFKKTLEEFFRRKNEELENYVAMLRGSEIQAEEEFIKSSVDQNVQAAKLEAIEMCKNAGYTEEDANKLIMEAIDKIENPNRKLEIVEEEKLQEVVEEPVDMEEIQEVVEEPVSMEANNEIEMNEERVQPEKKVESKENTSMYMTEEERVEKFVNSAEFQEDLKKLKDMRFGLARMEANLAPYKKYGPMDGDGYLYAKEEQERIDAYRDKLEAFEAQMKKTIDEFFRQRKDEIARMETNLAPYKKYGPMDGDGYLYAKEEQERIDMRKEEMNRNMDYLLNLAGIEVARPINMKVTINDLENGEKAVTVYINDKKIYSVNIPENEFSSKKVEEISNSALLAYTISQNKKNKAVINYNGKTIESDLNEIDKGIDKAIKAVSEEKEEIKRQEEAKKQAEIEEQKKAEEAKKQKELEAQKLEEEKKKAEEQSNAADNNSESNTEEEELDDNLDLGEDYEEMDDSLLEQPEPLSNNPLNPYDSVNEMAMKVTNSRNLNMAKKSALTTTVALAAIGLGAAASLPVSIPIALVGGAALYQYSGVIKDGIEFASMQAKCRKIAKKYKDYNIAFVYDTEKRRADFVHYKTKSDMKKGKNGVYITEGNYHDIFAEGADEAFVRDFLNAFAKENKRRNGDGARGKYPQITPFDLRTAFVGIGGIKTPAEIAVGSVAIESYRADIEKAAIDAMKVEEVTSVSPEEVEEVEEVDNLEALENTPEVEEISSELNAEVSPEKMVEAIDEEIVQNEEVEAPALEQPEVEIALESFPEVAEVAENIPVIPKEETPEEVVAELDNTLKEQQVVEPPVVTDPFLAQAPVMSESNSLLTPEEINELLGNMEVPMPTPESPVEEKQEFLENVEKENEVLVNAPVAEDNIDIFEGMAEEIKELTGQSAEAVQTPVVLSENVRAMATNFEENYKDVTDVAELDQAVKDYIEQAKMLGTITTVDEEHEFTDYCNRHINAIVTERTDKLWSEIVPAIGPKTGKDHYLDVLDDFINRASDSTDIESMGLIIEDQQRRGNFTPEEYNALKESLDNKAFLLQDNAMEKGM